ncbi:MAG: hypothetical protein CMF04_08905 [Hyphomonas sp.]|nr:hypothetical protein [Hyphomonas sp.]|tara:strand:+ start:5201 stop:5479 length:279 start_codon:yes stop_codon:yes gene_type:complete
MLSEKALEAVFNRVMSASGMPDNDDINYDRWFLEAALTALAEEGYVIVPREPTEAMSEMGRFAMRFQMGSEIPHLDEPNRIYRAMIAAEGEG